MRNGVIARDQFFGVLWLKYSARNGVDSESLHTESVDLLGLFRVEFNLHGLGLKPVRAQSVAVRVDCHNVRKILLPVRIELASMSPS